MRWLILKKCKNIRGQRMRTTKTGVKRVLQNMVPIIGILIAGLRNNAKAHNYIYLEGLGGHARASRMRSSYNVYTRP